MYNPLRQYIDDEDDPVWNVYNFLKFDKAFRELERKAISTDVKIGSPDLPTIRTTKYDKDAPDSPDGFSYVGSMQDAGTTKTQGPTDDAETVVFEKIDQEDGDLKLIRHHVLDSHFYKVSVPTERDKSKRGPKPEELTIITNLKTIKGVKDTEKIEDRPEILKIVPLAGDGPTGKHVEGKKYVFRDPIDLLAYEKESHIPDKQTVGNEIIARMSKELNKTHKDTITYIHNIYTDLPNDPSIDPSVLVRKLIKTKPTSESTREERQLHNIANNVADEMIRKKLKKEKQTAPGKYPLKLDHQGYKMNYTIPVVQSDATRILELPVGRSLYETGLGTEPAGNLIWDKYIKADRRARSFA